MTYANANRPRHWDTDRIGKAGYMLAAVSALLIVTALVAWPGPTNRQAGSDPTATTVGMGGQDNFPPPVRKK
jgi:hypothetical protein